MQVAPTESSESSPSRGGDGAGSERLIDFDKLLVRIGRNADLFRDLVSLFLSTQPKDIKNLRQAIDAGDPPRSKQLAHRIAGSFASMAMDSLARRAMDIERQATTGDLDTCKSGMAELEMLSEIVNREITGALSVTTTDALASTPGPRVG